MYMYMHMYIPTKNQNDYMYMCICDEKKQMHFCTGSQPEFLQWKATIAHPTCRCIVPDIIKFIYYHCTSIDFSVLSKWSTLYCTTQYYTLVLYYAITYKCKGIHTLLWLQYKVVCTIVLLKSTVDCHLIKV